MRMPYLANDGTAGTPLLLLNRWMLRLLCRLYGRFWSMCLRRMLLLSVLLRLLNILGRRIGRLRLVRMRMLLHLLRLLLRLLNLLHWLLLNLGGRRSALLLLWRQILLRSTIVVHIIVLIVVRNAAHSVGQFLLRHIDVVQFLQIGQGTQYDLAIAVV